jgi:hypothetical protein
VVAVAYLTRGGKFLPGDDFWLQRTVLQNVCGTLALRQLIELSTGKSVKENLYH